MQRKRLYGKDASKDKIAEINGKLRALRKDVRMWDRIMTDVEIIKEHRLFIKALEQWKNDMRGKNHNIR